jgi:hypothetical protein
VLASGLSFFRKRPSCETLRYPTSNQLCSVLAANSRDKVMRFPLDVLLVSSELGLSYSAHEGCVKSLLNNPAVRSYGFTDLRDEAERVINEGKTNTVFIDPCTLRWDAASFIVKMRRSFPKTVFVLYAEPACRARFCKAHSRFSKYFYLESFVDYWYGIPATELVKYQTKLDFVIRECENWLRESYQFDFAISFAGEQRAYAEKLARQLSAKSARVFYDRFERTDLLGNDLYTKLYEIYSRHARYCIMLISKSYITKVWTTHERQAIQERLLLDRSQGYLIPIRVDRTKIPGMPASLAYSNISEGIPALSKSLIEKVDISASRQSKKCFCDTRRFSLQDGRPFYLSSPRSRLP